MIEDNGGSFSTSISIEVPPGPASSQPELGLYYSSVAGNGPLGVGWALPYSTVRLDTRWGVPEYWARGAPLCDPDAFNGRLFVDDAELVPNPDDPLAPASNRCVFRTRPDSFSLVVPIFGVGCGGTQSESPTGWAVVKADGSTWWYGDPDDCVDRYRIRAPAFTRRGANGGVESVEGVTVEWLLQVVEDRHGNQVRFHVDRGEPSPAEPYRACDGCLRGISWARDATTRGSDDYAWALEGPSASDPLVGDPPPIAAGLTARFPQWIADPTSYWPPPQAHHHYASIEWEPRPDVRASFISGARRVQDRRIRQIAIGAYGRFLLQGDVMALTSNGSPPGGEPGPLAIRTYRLDYQTGSTGRSQLTRVWDLPSRWSADAQYPGLPQDGTAAWDPGGCRSRLGT